MGIGEGLGAAFEAIGDAMLESSKRSYETKREGKKREEQWDYDVKKMEKAEELRQANPYNIARTEKLGRVGTPNGPGAANIFKTPQRKNAAMTTMANVDEETRIKYRANPELIVADPIFKDTLKSYVGTPGNKGGDKMAQLGVALGVKPAGAPAPAPAPAASAPSKNSQAVAWAKANPNDPRAARIMKLQGL